MENSKVFLDQGDGHRQIHGAKKMQKSLSPKLDSSGWAPRTQNPSFLCSHMETRWFRGRGTGGLRSLGLSNLLWLALGV